MNEYFEQFFAKVLAKSTRKHLFVHDRQLKPLRTQELDVQGVTTAPRFGDDSVLAVHPSDARTW